MILKTANGFNYHVSRGDSGTGYSGMYGYGALRTSEETDPVGLSAVASAIRLVSETISTFVMRVYTGDASRRQPMLDAPQAGILQDGAPDYCTSADLWSDLVTSGEIYGTALIWKARDGDGFVKELYPFPAETAFIYVDTDGNRRVQARINGERVDITRDVIVVRGWSPFPAVEGKSTIRLHRRALYGAVALEEHRGRYFENDSTPNLVLTGPRTMTDDQRKKLRESWNARHGGPDGEKTAVLWGGVTVQQLTSSLAESQVAQLATLDVASVARMFRIHPASLLGVAEERTLPDAENITNIFHRLSLAPRIKKIERALSADRELFPNPRVAYAMFDTTQFTAGNLATTAAMIHQLVQVGALTPNEGRSYLGLPPSTDPAADKLLATPVGGAPNADTPAPSLNGVANV